MPSGGRMRLRANGNLAVMGAIGTTIDLFTPYLFVSGPVPTAPGSCDEALAADLGFRCTCP
jgi:hypothetical protein